MDCVFLVAFPKLSNKIALGLGFFLVRGSPVPFICIEFLLIIVTWGRKGGHRAGEQISSIGERR